VGIPADDQSRIFEEYQQLDNEARERSKGIGLGLAIVQQLADLLEHRVSVGSVLGAGSMFAIELPLIHPLRTGRSPETVPRTVGTAPHPGKSGAVLVVEDDPELRELLMEVLSADGHRVLAAASGPEALAAVQRDRFRADVILIDYNLPGGMDGMETSRHLNRISGRTGAVIVLTGDISTRAQLAIETGGATRLSKPIKTELLRETMRQVLVTGAGAAPRDTPRPAVPDDGPVVYLVDDDDRLRLTLCEVLEAEGHTILDFASCEAFLQGRLAHRESCLLLDAYLPGMSGLELIRQLSDTGRTLPTVVMTGRSDISTAVNAMKAGAIDFIQKPVSRDDLVECIDRALERSRDTSRASEWRDDAIRHIHALTPRQREVMDLVLAGHPSKNIAADLGISQRTVENHRASIMKRTGTRSLPALARLAVAAALSSETTLTAG
jgi:two-component system CheB/CheR fusion protein